jgi:26S proteasome regulatory subunit N5
MTDQTAADVLNTGLGSLAKDPKATEDFSKEAEEVLAKATTQHKAGRTEEAVEEILAVEKKARQACDGISCSKLIKGIVNIYHDSSPPNWAKINEYTVLLTKKRGQLKVAITDLVHLCTSWIEGLEKDVKLELIKTLMTVTEGKIFVEVEKARLTKTLADIKEKDGDLDEATNLIQEVQVETFSAMERREKAEYILNQMRLVLLKKDWVRTQIISKKINTKLLEADDFQDLKVQYYKYMIEYYIHEEQNLDVAKCFNKIYDTKMIQDDESKWKDALTNHTIYLLLAPYDNEQKDMLLKLDTIEAKKMEKVPHFQQLVKDFLRDEIMQWPLSYGDHISGHSAFKDSPYEGGESRWKLMKKRVVQHNINTVSGYYTRIRTKRLADLVNLTEKEAEAELSELVCAKFLAAKIDRPAGIIKFGRKLEPVDRLNDWSSSISKMLDLVENSCHLIQKEQMVHAARAKIKAKK